MAAVTLKGGPELRARLESIGNGNVERKIYVDWKKETLRAIRTSSRWQSARMIRGVYGGEHRAAVIGPFWFIFLDRGTKAHDIKVQSATGPHLYRGRISTGRQWITSVQLNGPEKGYGNPKALAASNSSRTVFGKKVHRRAMRRQPFITAAARAGARQALSAETVITLWNRKRGGKSGRWTRVKAA